MKINARLLLVIGLGRALQVVYGLTDRQFFFFVIIAGAVVFIINGLTHSDEIDADEAAEKGVKKAKTTASELKSMVTGEKGDRETTQQTIQHNSPKPWVILVDAVHCLVDSNGQVNQELFSLLETYPQRKIIATNANDEKIKQYHLNELPYDLFTMKHFPTKLDPIYFATLVEKFDLDESRTVYFDHDISALLSAKARRIKGFHYEGDLVALKGFLDSALRKDPQP